MERIIDLPVGLSRKPHTVVIARRNDEAIQAQARTAQPSLPPAPGLLHSVRNDGTELSRQFHIADKHSCSINS
ncbi:MAG: hypothetical protein LBJ47_07775 [Tannerella sp.]|nr:hypothetical protein [Tannerella sp.]